MPLVERLLEDMRLFRSHLRRGSAAHDFDWVFRDVALFEQIMARWTDKSLPDARVFEIGFGPRPYRLRAILATGADAYGVDAEVPLLAGRPAEYWAILRRNGWERLLKTFIRHTLFDRGAEASFRRALQEHGLKPTPVNPQVFLIGDAAECDPPGKLDLIYSHAVFEHIERASLQRLVPRMASWLAPGGLALIRPDVFTGLHGGHMLEWEADTFDLPVERRSEPWEHLRARRYTANTTLNELTRGEYSALFAEHFEILEIVDAPRGGAAAFLTPEIRAELENYTEEDLLDGNPLFVMRPRVD